MSSTNFIDQTTPIVASWLNDVNTATYTTVPANTTAIATETTNRTTADNTIVSNLAASTGSSLVGQIASGTGATARTVQSKLRESVSVKDFGAVGDGVTDDTAAFTAALNSGSAQVTYSNIHAITSITIPANVTLRALATSNTTTCYLVKLASSTSYAITLSSNSKLAGGGLKATVGSTGGGIIILGNSASIEDFYNNGNSSAGIGITVGTRAGATHTNCNSWFMKNVQSNNWLSHGFYFSDDTSPTTAPDVNAGNAIQCIAQSNGGDGFRIANAALNNFIGCLGEANTGNGIVIGYSGAYRCYDTFIIGGDYEANTGNQVLFDTNARNCGYQSIAHNTVVIQNSTTYCSNVNAQGYDFLPSIWLSNNTGVSITNALVSGTSITMTTSAAHGLSVGDTVWQQTSLVSEANGSFLVTAVDTPVTGVTYTVTLRTDVVDPWNRVTSGACTGTVRRCCGTSLAKGHYTIQNGICTFGASITLSSKVSTGSVEFTLPNSPKSISGDTRAFNVTISGTSGTFSTSGGSSIYISQNTNVNQILYKQMGVGLTPFQLQDTDITTTATFLISGWYWI